MSYTTPTCLSRDIADSLERCIPLLKGNDYIPKARRQLFAMILRKYTALVDAGTHTRLLNVLEAPANVRNIPINRIDRDELLNTILSFLDHRKRVMHDTPPQDSLDALRIKLDELTIFTNERNNWSVWVRDDDKPTDKLVRVFTAMDVTMWSIEADSFKIRSWGKKPVHMLKNAAGDACDNANDVENLCRFMSNYYVQACIDIQTLETTVDDHVILVSSST